MNEDELLLTFRERFKSAVRNVLKNAAEDYNKEKKCNDT